MPKITITGQATKAFNQTYGEANYENRNVDMRGAQARNEASYENQERDRRQTSAYREAGYENQMRTLEAQQRQKALHRFMQDARSEATYENRERDMRAAVHRRTERSLTDEARSEATYENRERDMRAAIHRRAEKDLMDRSRTEATYENRDRDIRTNRQQRLERASYNADRQAADYENRNRDLSFDRAYRDASYENQARDAAAGGGSGGSGGGGRGSGYVPFLGGFGFGNTAGMLGRLIGGGLILDEVMRVAEEAALAPQKIGDAEGAALASASPYIALKQQAYGFGRNAGFRGIDLENEFFPGKYAVPPWMSALGVTPPEAMQSLLGFGISPLTAGQGAGIARGLSALPYLPGLGDLDTRSHMSAMAAYGLVAPNEGGILKEGYQVESWMTNAIAKGMNRADILKSIDAAVSKTADSGAAGVNKGAMADWLMRFTDLPGGRTGEVGLQALGGLRSANAMVGTDPLRTMMYAYASRHIRSEADLKKLMNKEVAPGASGPFESLMGSPVGQKEVQYYLTARKRGDYNEAAYYLGVIANNSPAAMQALLTQSDFFPGNMPEGMRTRVGAVLTNTSVDAYIDTQLNGPGSSIRAPADTALQPFYQGGGMVDDPSKSTGYPAGLHAMGVRDDMIPIIMREARRTGMNPLIIGATMMKESTGGHDSGAGKNVMQIDPSNKYWKAYKINPTEQNSIALGATVLGEDWAASGGDVHRMMEIYNTGGGHGKRLPDNYWRTFTAAMSAGVGGMALSGMNPGIAGAGQGMMEGASVSMTELNILVPKFNEAVSDVTDGLKAVSRELNRLKKTLDKMPDPYSGPTGAMNLQGVM